MCGGPLQEDGTCPSCDGGVKKEETGEEDGLEKEEGADDAEEKGGDGESGSGEDW